MAVCKRCGNENEALPSDWINWECEDCFRGLLYESCGAFSRQERRAATLHHASALPINDELYDLYHGYCRDDV